MNAQFDRLVDRLKQSTFARFFIVGTIGFITDAGILQAGLSLLHLSAFWARVPSFGVAVLVTWYLNRNFTFGTPEKSFRESFPPYLASNAFGLSMNLAIYGFCVFLGVMPIIALASASIAAMFFNFAMAKFVVFRKK